MSGARELLPRLPLPDSTLALRIKGYEFISSHCERLHADAFAARLLGERVICLGGPEAVDVFYDPTRFTRVGAAPMFVQKTLFGQGGVQGLDGEEHHLRKAMFMSVMTRPNIQDFLSLLREECSAAAFSWTGVHRVGLLDEMQGLLCRAACRWSGLALDDESMRQLAHDCAKMVDGFASFGRRMLLGRVARRRSEALLSELVRQARGDGSARRGVVLASFLDYRGADGKPLDDDVAAVELLNIVRPIVAIATYVSFAALALRDHPAWRDRLVQSDNELRAFVQEVRRYYPFTPFVGARVRSTFGWNGVQFEPKRLVLLDVYGINHDARLWEEPHQFRPERFLSEPALERRLIPQGGGDHYAGHRCAGEWLTISAIEEVLKILTRRIRYRVPAQDLSYSLARFPTIPRSGVVLEDIHLAGDDATLKEARMGSPDREPSSVVV